MCVTVCCGVLCIDLVDAYLEGLISILTLPAILRAASLSSTYTTQACTHMHNVRRVHVNTLAVGV